MGEKEPKKDPSKKGESILAQGFVEFVLDQAKEGIRVHGHLEPALFLRVESGERMIVPLTLLEHLETTGEKQEYFAALGLSARLAGHRVREALLVSEVWYVRPEEDTLNVAPSRHPKRKEAIVIVGRDAQGALLSHVIQPFGRGTQNQPVFEPLAVAEYSVSPEEEYQVTSLVDYLFDQPLLPDRNDIL